MMMIIIIIRTETATETTMKMKVKTKNWLSIFSDCSLDNESYGDENVLSALIRQFYGISYYIDDDDGTRKEIAGHDFIRWT